MLSQDNVTLREFTENDIADKVKWINDSRNNEFLHYNIPLNEKDTYQWFLKKDNDKRKDFVIEYNGISIGIIGILNIDNDNLKGEYYVTIGDVAYKNKGIASKATNLILQFSFVQLGLNKVYLNVDAENEIACNLYEKTGFKCEGVFLEDMWHKGKFINRKRYALLRQDYLIKKGLL